MLQALVDMILGVSGRGLKSGGKGLNEVGKGLMTVGAMAMAAGDETEAKGKAMIALGDGLETKESLKVRGLMDKIGVIEDQYLYEKYSGGKMKVELVQVRKTGKSSGSLVLDF